MTTQSNLPSDDGSPSLPQSISHKFEFTGTASELWPIILKNLLFNILTLSLYRFWARTNVRRYLWENTRFMGDPFEYTGRGGEMFMGFVIVLFVVFLPLVGLITWAQILIAQGDTTLGMTIFIVTYTAFLWLVPYGLYRAKKYRLSRTRWRGIRGAQVGSGVGFAWATFGYFLLIPITLGFAYPYIENQLWKKETNSRRFGSGKFEFEADSGPLYKAFFAYFGIAILGFLIFGLLNSGLASGGTPGAGAMVTFFMSYLLLLFVLGVAFAFYLFKQLEHFWNNSTFEKSPFSFRGDLPDLIKLFIGNFVLILITLGIAFPITQMRFIRYIVSNMSIEGEVNLAAISQSDEEEPSFGEGLAEGFDMGTI